MHKRKIFFSRLKRKILKHIWLSRIAILVLVLLNLLLILFLFVSLLRKTNLEYYQNLVYDFIFAPSEKVKLFQNRTNLVVLGKGGKGHEAPDLTDTIIFVSVAHNLGRIDIVSLPRDIWIPHLRAKLNSAYYWGNQKSPGGGLILAKSTVEEIVGVPIHYGIVIDFSGFKKIVDVLGGIEVFVERSFIDEKYPIVGRENDECDNDPEFRCRYEKISFEAGSRFMDGETALKFVRSRNAEGDEGTDIARTKRQQKIIVAIKEKVLSREILLHPTKFKEILEVVNEFVETDIDSSASVILARRLLESNKEIRSHDLPEDFLVNPPISSKFDNLYVFIPRLTNWLEVHEWVGVTLLR